MVSQQLFNSCFNQPLTLCTSSSSLSNDGITIMAKDNPNYEQVKGEFEALFQMNDPSFEESNYKQFVTMAM